jgi:hypothetical protein
VSGEDDVPEVPETPVARAGDLWLLRGRRLLCGDATVAADVSRLLGGVVPQLMVTDPPYGLDCDPGWRTRWAQRRTDARQSIRTLSQP